MDRRQHGGIAGRDLVREAPQPARGGRRSARVEAVPAAPCFLTRSVGEVTLTGYEIHMGQVVTRAGVSPAFSLRTRNGRGCEVGDGAVDASGRVAAWMVGILTYEARAWGRGAARRPDFERVLSDRATGAFARAVGPMSPPGTRSPTETAVATALVRISASARASPSCSCSRASSV